MQAREAKKNKTAVKPPVKKPNLRGKAFSALAFRRGLRILSYVLVSAVLYFFLGQLMVIDIVWLRVLINSAIIFAFCALLYGSGARDGETDVSFGEIAWNRREQGQEVSEADLAKCFHPLKGFAAVLLGTLPLVLLCLVYALVAVRDHYTLGSLPSWMAGYLQRQDIGLALAYYQQPAAFGLQDGLRMLVRLLVFPFVNMMGAENARAVLWVERLSPLLVMLAPMAHGLGYLRGERLRAMVHGGIAAGQRKKRRQEARTKRQPEQLL